MTEEATNTEGDTVLTSSNTEGEATDPETGKAVEGASNEEGANAKTDGKADEKATGAPESYEDFTLPEGVELNEELMGEFKPLAKELNLSQEQAQKLVDLQANEMAKITKAQEQTWNDLNESWVDQAMKDEEIGGKSETEFKEKVAVATKALEKFGTPELRQALDLTGAGNHPEILRFAYRVGKALSEDQIVGSRSSGSEEKSPEKVLFPDMN